MSEPLIPNAPGWWVLQSGPDLWCIEVRDAPPNGLWYPIPAFHDDGLFVELFGDLAALAADTGGRWLGMVTPDLFSRDLVHVNAVRVVAEDAARLSAELAQARADLEAAQDRLTWPRWMEAWDGSFGLVPADGGAYLAIVTPEDGVWRPWLGIGCSDRRSLGGFDEAEAHLAERKLIRPGCTIRPAGVPR